VAQAISGLRDGVLDPQPHTLLDTLLLANRYALVASPLGSLVDDHEPGPLDAATLQVLRDEAAETAQALGDAALV
jgi:hypothetical protein